MPTQEIPTQVVQTFPYRPHPVASRRRDDLFLEDCQSEAGGCHPTDDGQSGFAPGDDPRGGIETEGTLKAGAEETSFERRRPRDLFLEDCQSEAGGCHPTDDGQSGLRPEDGFGDPATAACIETWAAPSWPPAF